jgi:hypothetical protein
MTCPDPTVAAPLIPCDGWWDQHGFGRQPMLQLQMRISGGKISGSGTDIVGLFTFTGTISEGGAVAMIKKYLGKHQVEYLGSYDGEGTMFGEWRIGPVKDRWLITFRRPKMAMADDGEDVVSANPAGSKF